MDTRQLQRTLSWGARRERSREFHRRRASSIDSAEGGNDDRTERILDLAVHLRNVSDETVPRIVVTAFSDFCNTLRSTAVTLDFETAQLPREQTCTSTANGEWMVYARAAQRAPQAHMHPHRAKPIPYETKCTYDTVTHARVVLATVDVFENDKTENSSMIQCLKSHMGSQYGSKCELRKLYKTFIPL